MQPSEMASLSNFKWQTRKKRPNRSTNNGNMVEKAKREVVSEGVTSISNYREAKLLKSFLS